MLCNSAQIFQESRCGMNLLAFYVQYSVQIFLENYGEIVVCVIQPLQTNSDLISGSLGAIEKYIFILFLSD